MNAQDLVIITRRCQDMSAEVSQQLTCIRIHLCVSTVTGYCVERLKYSEVLHVAAILTAASALQTEDSS